MYVARWPGRAVRHVGALVAPWQRAIELDVATPWLTAAIGENFGSNHSIEVGGTQIERDANGRLRCASAT